MRNLLIIFILFFYSSPLLYAEQQTKVFGYFTNRVVSSDMIPTLLPGDLILSDPDYYNNKEIYRGDIVLLNSLKKDGNIWVKRIIGLPSEILEIRNGKVYVNDFQLTEEYVAPKNNIKVSSKIDIIMKLNENEYFVMGDNRDNSNDSRFLGPINKTDILAKPLLIYFSKDFIKVGQIKNQVANHEFNLKAQNNIILSEEFGTVLFLIVLSIFFGILCAIPIIIWRALKRKPILGEKSSKPGSAIVFYFGVAFCSVFSISLFLMRRTYFGALFLLFCLVFIFALIVYKKKCN